MCIRDRRDPTRGAAADAHTGVINLDAHFDLREAPEATSGTPFLQMARADLAAGRAFDYTVLGIAAPANTRVPVSYTHLDVYKRQAVRCPGRPAR